MANVFNSVKGLHPRRNAFSAHTYRNDFTGKLGLNIPVYQQHVTAGTRVKVSTSALVRLQALIAPVMDNIDFYVHFWKIPYRLLENDRFTQFISGEIDQEEYQGIFLTPSAFVENLIGAINGSRLPSYSSKIKCFNSICGNGGILDFLGYDYQLFGDVIRDGETNNITLETDPSSTSLKFNFRPLIAYYMLHLHWYMNENVPYFRDFPQFVDDIINKAELQSLYIILIETYIAFGSSLLPHGWEKDYFTSALPNVQYGDPVSLGLAGSAPVSVPAQTVIMQPATSPVSLNYIQFGFMNGTEASGENLNFQHLASDKGYISAESNSDNAINQILGKLEGNTQDGHLTASADLSEASAITINELRFANALQVFKEREQRFGRRRLEYYKGFFDVTPEDLRLQVPAYLGGGRIPINISDIEQTSSTSGESRPLASLAGKATAVAGGFAGFSTFCSEESIILGIAFAMPHITYANATSKFLLKTNDKFDYFNPSFEHLGEQAILNLEVFPLADYPEDEFGYTPRFNEYRFHMNEMHGQFKGSLAYWSLGRIFGSEPALNADFVYMQPRAFDRIFAVSNQDNMIASMLFRTRLIQPVSKYGTPRIMV